MILFFLVFCFVFWYTNIVRMECDGMAYERNNGVHIDDFINMVGVPIGSIVSKKVVFLDDKALIVSEPYKDKGYHFSDSEKDSGGRY